VMNVRAASTLELLNMKIMQCLPGAGTESYARDLD
jgi:hypothetical protein